MTEQTLSRSPIPGDHPGSGKEGGVAALGALAGFSAFLAAAACCVLPAALAAVGVGAGVSSGFSALAPYHWPLSIAAMLAVAVGWLLYVRRRTQCRRNATCAAAPPTQATFIMLCLATAFVALSTLFPYFVEAPLMRAMGAA